MSDYYGEIESVGQFRDIYVPTQEALNKILPQILTLEQRYSLMDDIPDDLELPFPWAHAGTGPNQADAEAVLGRLLGAPEAEALYSAMGRTQGRHYANMARIRDQAVNLIELIEAQ